MWIHTMRWPEVQEYLRNHDLILLPVGSTEQHGYHAPLGVDTLIAMRLAEDAARSAGVLCAPALPFGWSPHHLVLPGTITVRAEILIGLLEDMVGSLARHGFRRFVVVNGHRITNLPWLQIAAERVQSALGVTVSLFDPAYMGKEIGARLGLGPIGHADELETSHLLHLHPELLYMPAAVDSPEHARPLYHVDPRAPHDTLCYVPSTAEQMALVARVTGGSTGRPTRASREAGRQLHEHLVKRLVEVIGGGA